MGFQLICVSNTFWKRLLCVWDVFAPPYTTFYLFSTDFQHVLEFGGLFGKYNVKSCAYSINGRTYYSGLNVLRLIRSSLTLMIQSFDRSIVGALNRPIARRLDRPVARLLHLAIVRSQERSIGRTPDRWTARSFDCSSPPRRRKMSSTQWRLIDVFLGPFKGCHTRSNMRGPTADARWVDTAHVCMRVVVC